MYVQQNKNCHGVEYDIEKNFHTIYYMSDIYNKIKSFHPKRRWILTEMLWISHFFRDAVASQDFDIKITGQSIPSVNVRYPANILVKFEHDSLLETVHFFKLWYNRRERFRKPSVQFALSLNPSEFENKTTHVKLNFQNRAMYRADMKGTKTGIFVNICAMKVD